MKKKKQVTLNCVCFYNLGERSKGAHQVGIGLFRKVKGNCSFSLVIFFIILLQSACLNFTFENTVKRKMISKIGIKSTCQEKELLTG